MQAKELDELQREHGAAVAEVALARTASETAQDKLVKTGRELWLAAFKEYFPGVPLNVRGQILEGSFANDPGKIIALREGLKQKGITVHGIEADSFGFRLLC